MFDPAYSSCSPPEFGQAKLVALFGLSQHSYFAVNTLPHVCDKQTWSGRNSIVSVKHIFLSPAADAGSKAFDFNRVFVSG